MLAIRLQRNGRTHLPVYRIIVQEAQRHPLSGRVVAEIGHYNPHTKDITLNREKAEFYLAHGAQPSTRVVRLFKVEKITLPKWVDEGPRKQVLAKHPDKLRKNQPKEETPADAAPESTSEEPQNAASDAA